jgi:hypothetical protein
VSRQTRKPGRLSVLKDVLSYVFGMALITYQALFVPPKDVNEWFLLLGGSLIGVPGVAEILAWRARGSTGTEAPDSSPQPPDSQQPESHSSSIT